MQKSIERFLVLLLFVVFTLPVFAQTDAGSPDGSQGPLVKAQLLAESDGIKPGGMLRVALRQEITPGWHTYWRNPGDTGLATTIDWQLPPGFSASELHFPTPSRQMIGGLTNFGYENEVMILADITAPSNLTLGDSVDIKGKASWLVCQETCIPESASFLLTVPVVENPVSDVWSSAFNAVSKTLPQAHNAKQSIHVTPEAIILTVDPLPLPENEIPEEAYFYPHDGLLIQHGGEQKLDLDGRKGTLTLQRNKSRTDPIDVVSGDLWLRSVTGATSWQINVKAPAPPAPVQAAAQSGENATGYQKTEIGFVSAIILAFLGGLLLNLMPCVFPVLSLKALALVKKAHHGERREVITGGLSYMSGVLVSFAVLGLILGALKSSGHAVGWGAQLQSPVFVAAMALLLFFIGYALSGAVTLGSNLVGVGNALTNKSGHIGSFFTGALAVVVATPCTAPFMGGAVFYALTQPMYVTLLVMLAMGFGLAFPYLFLCLVPGALRFLPRPGIWMEHFKQLLAFPMIGAAIWLVWVLAQQTGSSGVLFALFSMLSLAFGFWLWRTTQNRPVSIWQKIKKILAVLFVLFAGLLVSYQPSTLVPPRAETSDYYEAYTGDAFNALRSSGKPVFVNMTAAWCITCLANEKAALSTDKVRSFFKDSGITYLKGDWTNYDDSITAFLKEFGRSGVPLYVFYPADATQAPVVLPQILTPDTVIEAITAAQPSLTPLTQTTQGQ